MEKSHFWGDWWFFMWFLVILLVGTGEPLPYCNKNTLGKIESKFGIGRSPPPQLGQKTKFFDRFNLRSPLSQGFEAVAIGTFKMKSNETGRLHFKPVVKLAKMSSLNQWVKKLTSIHQKLFGFTPRVGHHGAEYLSNLKYLKNILLHKCEGGPLKEGVRTSLFVKAYL